MEQLPDSVRRVAAQHHRELLSLDKRSRLAVQQRLQSVIDDLTQELDRGGASSFRSGELSILKSLAATAQARTVEEMEALLETSMAEAWGAASGDVGAEINAWIEHHGGEVRPINLGAVSQVERETLVERYEASMATYGALVAERIKEVVSTAIIARQGRESVVDAIQQAIERDRYSAARIVRTETMNAYNAGHNAGLFEARDSGQVPGLKKSCLVTFDSRTARDSFPLQAQVKELEDFFVDGEGRRYMHPPGRPNDREKEIPWLDDLDPILTETPENAETIRAQRQAEEEADASLASERAKRLKKDLRAWDKNGQSKAAIKLKRASLEEFGLPGTVYTKRNVKTSPEELAVARGDVRAQYEETQAAFRAQDTGSVTLYRAAPDGEVDMMSHFEAWSTTPPPGEYFTDEVDVRRILASGVTDGEFIVMPSMPQRRFVPGDFQVGFFDASEVDPAPQVSGPFGLLRDGDTRALYHVPSGTEIISGEYTPEEMRLFARQLEQAGHVDSQGRLAGWEARDSFETRAEELARVALENRRAERREAREELAWKKQDFEIGFFNAKELDPGVEVAGNWGVLEYGATEDKEAGAALYHVPSGREVISGAYRRGDLRRVAQDLDPFLARDGKLPEERQADYGDFDEEVTSARMFYARQRVNGFPDAVGADRYVSLGDVDFPVINNPKKELKGRYSRRVIKVLNELDDGNFQVTEQKGYLKGEFFVYKTQSVHTSGNGYESVDWHLCHAKTGVEIHSGTSMTVSDSKFEVGGWRLERFKDEIEKLNPMFDDDGNVKEERAEDWLGATEALARRTSPNFDVGVYLGRDYKREDWIHAPHLRRTRSRIVEEEEVAFEGVVDDFLDFGPEIEEVEDVERFEDVPF